MKATIIGAGAMGGTIGAHMVRAGHEVILCDADRLHVDAINENGLRIIGPVNEFTVSVPAITPNDLQEIGGVAIVAVKSHHTYAAADLLSRHLSAQGYVLTVQNGLTAQVLMNAVGADRVVSSFVNFGADYIEPGCIMQGNIGTFRIGELRGGTITQRVTELSDALPYAEATDNVLGYLWGKEAYGAMLWAGALSDLSIADSLVHPKYRSLMMAVAQEVIDQAPVRIESFDGFVPEDLDGSLDRLAAFNRQSAKTHSGIYRDLVVRKRKTEIDEVLHDLNGPIFNKIGEMIHDIEQGRRGCEVSNLDELGEFVASL
jgi:2-dehydropantoate 2-reductase